MSYTKKQKKWIKKHDVQVGDFVMHASKGIVEIKKINDYIIVINNESKLPNYPYYHANYMLCKKVTDLKELAPFYIEIENGEQSRKAQEICFSHGIEKDEFHSGTLFIRNRNCKIYCLQFSGTYYNFYEREESRQLTYEQLLRFEKKPEEKEPKYGLYNENAFKDVINIAMNSTYFTADCLKKETCGDWIPNKENIQFSELLKEQDKVNNDLYKNCRVPVTYGEWLNKIGKRVEV